MTITAMKFVTLTASEAEAGKTDGPRGFCVRAKRGRKMMIFLPVKTFPGNAHP